MGRPARPLHEPGNHHPSERCSPCHSADSGSLTEQPTLLRIAVSYTTPWGTILRVDPGGLIVGADDRLRRDPASPTRRLELALKPLLRHSVDAYFRRCHRLLRIAVRAYDASIEKHRNDAMDIGAGCGGSGLNATSKHFAIMRSTSASCQS